MAARWRNRYRIIKGSPPVMGATPQPLRLACTICGAHKLWEWDETGEINDHCMSYATKEEASVYTREKYQLPRVETLGPSQGNYSPERPEVGRDGWN